MALIKCTNCGHTISDKAVKCPNCGSPTEQESRKKTNDQNSNKWKKHLLAFIAIAVVIGGLWGIWHMTDGFSLNEKSSSAKESELSSNESELQDSIKRETIKAAMPSIEDFFSFYHDDFQGIRNKYITWIPTDATIKALTAKGYQVKNTETFEVEGEGGDYYPVTTATLCYTIKEGNNDILYYEIKIEDGYCAGIDIVFPDEDSKSDFVMEALKFGFVQNSQNFVSGSDNADMLVWTLKGEDGQLWVDGAECNDQTITISEKSVRINSCCI